MVKKLVTATLLAISLTSISHAASIGINFTATRFGGGPYPILPHETAGLVPQQNWNNSTPTGNGNTADISSPVPGSIVDSSGSATPLQIEWFNGNDEVNTDGGLTTPDERLYRGIVEGEWFAPPSPQLAISVTNVPYPEYKVIVYLATFGFGATTSIQLGDEEYYLIQSSDFTTDGFIEATATSLETATLATYAVFDGLTDSSFEITLNKRGGNRPGIGGFQIVAVPEPSSAVLLGAGLLLGVTAYINRGRARS